MAEAWQMLWSQRQDIEMALMKEAMRRPLWSRPDATASRDSDNVTALFIGSSGRCDISTAVKGTVLAYTPPA